jgi:hypothetical protein
MTFCDVIAGVVGKRTENSSPATAYRCHSGVVCLDKKALLDTEINPTRGAGQPATTASPTHNLKIGRLIIEPSERFIYIYQLISFTYANESATALRASVLGIVCYSS